ncbi:MAG: hypothetical protein N2320_01220 [Candidatus Bipolaricaulota bacterium]|nr:hypothetical protein [Candidatus Bipolaricaulota bacterium]
MTRRKRRWLGFLGLGALVGAATLAALSVRAPRPAHRGEDPVPGAWSLAPGEEPAPEVPSEDPPLGEPGPAVPREGVPAGYVQAGKLAYELDGRRVAEESYRLERLSGGELLLLSEGTFSVRILLVSVQVAFQQELRLDEGLRPRAYRLEARGPLGLGTRRVSIAVEGGRAVADTGDGSREVPVPDGQAFFVGTIASYALLPVLYRAWGQGDALRLEPVGVGASPPGASTSGPVEVLSVGTIEVSLDERTVVLERYRLRAGAFAGILLARGLEFVAFVGEGERSFFAYRSDLFPRGLRLPRPR